MQRRAFLGMWIALALVGALTVLASGAIDADGGTANDQIVQGSLGSPDDPTVRPDAPVVPGPGQVRVRGSLTSMRLEGAVLAPQVVSVPLTVNSDRGFGNGGELTKVMVDGRASSIVWDGGRPFLLSGAGGLVPDPSVADLVPGGLRLSLGGGTHRLSPGSYRLDTPVAVGSSGVATPRDSVAFEATAESRFEARGDANVILPPDAPRRLVGPGRVELGGALELTDSAGTRTTTALTVDRAAFDITLTADGAGGWTIVGLLDSSSAP